MNHHHDQSCCSEHGMHPAPKPFPRMKRRDRVSLTVFGLFFAAITAYAAYRAFFAH